MNPRLTWGNWKVNLNIVPEEKIKILASSSNLAGENYEGNQIKLMSCAYYFLILLFYLGVYFLDGYTCIIHNHHFI